MALIIDPKFWAVFGTIYTFWVWLLPAIPIQIAFIMAYAGLLKLIKRALRAKENNNA